MLTREERAEIRAEVYADLAEIEYEVARHAGSYGYLCAVGGMLIFSHRPVGQVLRTIVHVPLSAA